MLERNGRLQAIEGSHSKFTLLSGGPFEQYMKTFLLYPHIQYSIVNHCLPVLPFIQSMK